VAGSKPLLIVRFNEVEEHLPESFRVLTQVFAGRRLCWTHLNRDLVAIAK